MSGIRKRRRELERQLKKGKVNQALKPHELLYQVKYVLNETQAQSLLKKIPQETKDYFEGCPLPKNYSEIRSKGETYIEDLLEKELYWYEKKILKYSKEVNLSITLCNSFDKALLSGDYVNAEEFLNLVETSVCVSHWSIENRLILSEYCYGFKKNKETLTSIIESTENQFAKIFAIHQSTRVEKNLSHFNFEEIFSKYLNRHDDLKIQEYLTLKLNFYNKLRHRHLGFALSYDSNSSIIDCYKSFVCLFDSAFEQRNL